MLRDDANSAYLVPASLFADRLGPGAKGTFLRNIYRLRTERARSRLVKAMNNEIYIPEGDSWNALRPRYRLHPFPKGNRYESGAPTHQKMGLDGDNADEIVRSIQESLSKPLPSSRNARWAGASGNNSKQLPDRVQRAIATGDLAVMRWALTHFSKPEAINQVTTVGGATRRQRSSWVHRKGHSTAPDVSEASKSVSLKPGGSMRLSISQAVRTEAIKGALAILEADEEGRAALRKHGTRRYSGGEKTYVRPQRFVRDAHEETKTQRGPMFTARAISGSSPKPTHGAKRPIRGHLPHCRGQPRMTCPPRKRKIIKGGKSSVEVQASKSFGPLATVSRRLKSPGRGGHAWARPQQDAAVADKAYDSPLQEPTAKQNVNLPADEPFVKGPMWKPIDVLKSPISSTEDAGLGDLSRRCNDSRWIRTGKMDKRPSTVVWRKVPANIDEGDRGSLAVTAPATPTIYDDGATMTTKSRPASPQMLTRHRTDGSEKGQARPETTLRISSKPSGEGAATTTKSRAIPNRSMTRKYTRGEAASEARLRGPRAKCLEFVKSWII